ncbi:HoxN/HupN/NixA family nickel/cobalt transporter [Nocardioides stalactiti]|uniref:HoxN/HupN/NixA family nickel/cobalt transporter n=1 Tax=Nocardioides stalactiti TaxID=2755356 RepID=UPI0028AF41B4|nr:HoxN/HupN/NixA family nickel/cobalt transporter [Nocardioides stalactiti]
MLDHHTIPHPATPAPPGGRAGDRRVLFGLLTAVVGLNVVGWGVLLLIVAPQDLSLGDSRVFGVGVGVTAFLLGARHAFDADHIAIIDNTTRKLVGEGTRSLGTGFWFALGHSSVVFGLALLLALGVRALVDPVQDDGSTLQHSLGIIGSLAAGTFLILIGLMNISALVGIVHVYRHLRAGTFDEDALHHHLHNRGLLARLFARAIARVRKPWHLYPVGLLMGLGFDTATQVALLVLAGGTAAYALPWYAVLVLPVLFTAGMTLFDTMDGLFMTRAYRWAVLDPARKLFYNFSVTLLSVAIALSIGAIVLLQLVAEEFDPASLRWIAAWDLNYVGFVLVGVFFVAWAASVGAFQLLGRRRAAAAGTAIDSLPR